MKLNNDLEERIIDNIQSIDFLNFPSYEDFDIVANVIENKMGATVFKKRDGIFWRKNSYALNDYEFNLYYHEDLGGNFLRSTQLWWTGADKESLRTISLKILKYLKKIRKNL